MQTNRKAVVVAVMLTNFLAAIDVTIVGTAMPTIIGQLGGLPIMAWVFSAFLLASAVSTPVFGKLSDLYGRKIMFTIASGLIIIGSVVCGLAENMLILVAGRAVQGLGAGSVIAIATTILGDLFSIEERGRIQGLFSGVWGISSILGPALGGLIIDFLSWPWVFFINVPIGIIGVILLWVSLHEEIEKKKQVIDYKGALTFTVSVTALLFALLQLDRWGWTDPRTWTLLTGSCVGIGAFLWIERNAREPMVPTGLFKNPVISVANATSFLIGAVLMGVTSYIPIFVQGVLGGSATEAGFTLTPMSVAWMVGSMVAGRNLVNWGFRRTAFLGVALIAAGSVLLSSLSIDTGRFFAMTVNGILGVGLGISTLAFTVAVQSEVDWKQRGITTATNQFIRSLGSTLGVAVMGTILNMRMRDELRGGPAAELQDPLETANQLLEQGQVHLPADVHSALTHALYSGLHSVYVWIGGFGLAAVLAMTLFPKREAQAEEMRS